MSCSLTFDLLSQVSLLELSIGSDRHLVIFPFRMYRYTCLLVGRLVGWLVGWLFQTCHGQQYELYFLNRDKFVCRQIH